MLNDMEKYQYKEQKHWKNILKKEKKGYNIQNITEELLVAWKEKKINQQTREYSKYVTESVIIELINLVKKELEEKNL